MAQAYFALIVAGGTGSRMGSELPKQFLPLAGKPVLAHTLQRFLAFDAALEAVLVLPAAHVATYQALVAPHVDEARIRLVEGGECRTESVYNGLQALQKHAHTNALVAVQDGVRPLCTQQMIADAFAAAAEHGAGVCAVPSKSSLRMKTSSGSQAVDRSLYYAVQTPQAFLLGPLSAAHMGARASGGQFTDDASLYEAYGGTVVLVPGSYANLKITTPVDLKLAELLLEEEASL